MADFTIGQCNFTTNGNHRGQSFDTNDQGPCGTGSSGGADPVYLYEVSVGYPNGNTANRPATIDIYDAYPLDSDGRLKIQSIATSNTGSPSNVFGTGANYSQTWPFSPRVALTPGTTYYFIFPSIQNIRYKTSNPYAGGSIITVANGTNNNDAQFLIGLSTTSTQNQTSAPKKRKTTPKKKPGTRPKSAKKTNKKVKK